MGTVKKTQYEQDQDRKFGVMLFTAWLCLLVWAWATAFAAEEPAQTWDFWLAFVLLWWPAAWFFYPSTEDDEKGLML